MSRLLLSLILLVAGCTATPRTEAPDSTVAIVVSPMPDARSPSAQPSASSLPVEPLPPLEGVLPTHLGDVELHTFRVGPDIIDRLFQRLGVGYDGVQQAYASEHGERFLQMYALRSPEVSGPEMLEAWAAVAYAPEVAEVSVSERPVAGRTVTVIAAPSMANQIGTFYAYTSGNMLLVVQAFDEAVATEALQALP